MKKGRWFDINCEIHDNGDTFWEDGCYRIYHANNREKESKVIHYTDGEKQWYYTFRDEDGNITKEYVERMDGKPSVGKGNRIMEAIDFESDTKNWKFPFERMTRFYGRDFIEMVKTMWDINDNQIEEEFCEMNGIPKGFFEKTIKGK